MSTFSAEYGIHLISVPGTPFVRLAQDENMARVVAERGTIVCEQAIAALPEVQELGLADLVLDVGAFIGDTAIIFAKRGAAVFAFEPQPDAFCAAVINTRHLPTVRIINAAVGNGETVRCNEDPLKGNSGTRTVRPDSAGGRALRLSDQPFARPVTFIKIDVEGFEPAVIRGALDLIKRDRPVLLIEIYPEMMARQGFVPSEVTDPLLRLGYSIREAIGNHTEPRWDILCTSPRVRG